jgi:hypothetical protein
MDSHTCDRELRRRETTARLPERSGLETSADEWGHTYSRNPRSAIVIAEPPVFPISRKMNGHAGSERLFLMLSRKSGARSTIPRSRRACLAVGKAELFRASRNQDCRG